MLIVIILSIPDAIIREYKRIHLKYIGLFSATLIKMQLYIP